MSIAHLQLQEFLTQHCEIKPITQGNGKERCYVFPTEGCVLFMAEFHVEQIKRVIDQTEDRMMSAKKSGDYSGVIMTYNWNAPEPGMDSVRIPVRLVESLDNKQAAIMLRNLEGIFKDIGEGKQRRDAIQSLFGDTAVVKTMHDLESERVYFITGKTSESDRRGYAERFAEQIATNVLFDLPKALNARLQTIVPKDYRGRFFVEGRDITAKKIRYGAEANIELVLTEEGAANYATLIRKEPKYIEELTDVFRRAVLDPFGLSLKHYMGKHPVIKIHKNDE